jgi:hypothetical protein
MGEHRDDTGSHKSLEEAILENIDQAAEAARAPATKALDTIITIKRIVLAGIVFVVFFALTTVYSLSKINEVSDNNQEYLVNGCVSGNQSRSQELGFWLAIFSEAAKDPKNQTAARKAQTQLLINQLHETYPQLDCNKVKDGDRVVIPTTK